MIEFLDILGLDKQDRQKNGIFHKDLKKHFQFHNLYRT